MFAGTLVRFGGQTLSKPNLLRGTQNNNPLLVLSMFCFFLLVSKLLTSGRLKSNDVAPRVGCSCFQILDQRIVLPCTRDILSRPTHFACLHDDMNVSSVVTMDHAIDAYSIWKCFMQLDCNLAPLILIIFAGYMYHTVLRT